MSDVNDCAVVFSEQGRESDCLSCKLSRGFGLDSGLEVQSGIAMRRNNQSLRWLRDHPAVR